MTLDLQPARVQLFYHSLATNPQNKEMLQPKHIGPHILLRVRQKNGQGVILLAIQFGIAKYVCAH